MLVLSRKVQETLVIDGRITVKILHVKGQVVRVGVEAPQSVLIRRGELIEHKEQPHESES